MIETEDGLVARNEQINQIEKYIMSKVDKRQPGILYLTGPPGTGKTMCVQLVMNRLRAMSRYKDVSKIDINCMKIQSARTILTNICIEAGLGKQITTKTNEVEMINKLTKKFSGRTCDTHIFVMDEIDHMPKSKNFNLIKTIFAWPSLAFSKLVLVGIANTSNLTSSHAALSSITSLGTTPIEKIIFRPYTASDIKLILNWYMENDENYQDAVIEPKALDMIAKKWAKAGDIRAALNACKSTMDDVVKEENKILRNTRLRSMMNNATSTPLSMNDFCKIRKRPNAAPFELPLKLEVCDLPDISSLTTPPPSPKPKARATLPSVANSIKKRQKNTNYEDDIFPFSHQMALFCVNHLISNTSKKAGVEFHQCYNLFTKLGARFSMSECRIGFRCILMNLENQGLICVRKARGRNNPSEKVYLSACESEINSRLVRVEMISNAFKCIRV